MANEPILLFKLSRPQTFRCSACLSEYRGDIEAEGWVIDVIDVFRDHVRRYHSKEENLSQAAVRVVREATDKI